MTTINGTRKRLSWVQFKRIPNGTRVRNHDFWDGEKMQPGDQCVAVANLYIESVLRLPFIPVKNARDFWEGFDKHPTLRQHFTKSSRPRTGSLMIALGGDFDAEAGHVEVITWRSKTRRRGRYAFNTRGQNAGNGAARWLFKWRRHSTDRIILGYIVPKVNPAQLAGRRIIARRK